VGDKENFFSPDKPHIIIMLEEGLKEGSLLTFLPPPNTQLLGAWGFCLPN